MPREGRGLEGVPGSQVLSLGASVPGIRGEAVYLQDPNDNETEGVNSTTGPPQTSLAATTAAPTAATSTTTAAPTTTPAPTTGSPNVTEGNGTNGTNSSVGINCTNGTNGTNCTQSGTPGRGPA